MRTDYAFGLGQVHETGSDRWVEVTSERNSPLHEYNGFGFTSPSYIPIDLIHDRSQETSYSTPPTLYIPQWPSQLTSPSQGPPPDPMPVVRLIAPATSTSAVQAVKAPTVKAAPIPAPQRRHLNPRKIITDSDRRRMCEYHGENPTVKQTEIGAMFGVERSTVSKVLRQKDKFLSADNGDQSPMKRTKVIFPDIDRTLSNWARNQLRLGLPLDDDLIRDKASFFAHTVGSSECLAKFNGNVWLEKFKQQNYLNGVGAKARKISCDADDFDAVTGIPISELKSGSRTPNGISPNSPDALHHPRSSKLEKVESPNGYVDYRHIQSKSATEATVSASFSPDIRSPTSAFFTPDTSCGPSPLVPSQHSRLPPLASAASRPRRQTFPAIGARAFATDPPVSEAPSMKNSHSSMAIPTLESPLEEMEESPLGLHSAVNHSTQQSHQTTPILSLSSLSMGPPPHPAPSGHSSPKPPSQDEARRAIKTLIAFFANQPSNATDLHECILMGRLMERLKLHGNPLPGGMHSLERGDGTLPIGRKRSIHSL